VHREPFRKKVALLVDVVNRHEQAIGFYHFVGDLLHDVLDVRKIGHPPGG
jgi:hypothetical protein